MAGYSQADFNSMQQDAIRRVKEMQNRTQNYVKDAGPDQPQQKYASAPNNTQNMNMNQNNQQSSQRFTQANNQQQNISNFSEHQNNINQNRPQNNNYNNPFSMLFGNNNQKNVQNFQKPSAEHTDEPQHPYEPEHSKGPLSGILDNFFPNLHIDEDKIIIILLIIILARNGSDIKLLLALGYLLM